MNDNVKVMQPIISSMYEMYGSHVDSKHPFGA